MEESGGGDALDGFAQAHFVGDHGSFFEGQVEHAFLLVWVEREEGLVGRVLASVDLLLVVALELEALGGVLLFLEPGMDLAGDPEFGGVCFFDGSEEFFG